MEVMARVQEGELSQDRGGEMMKPRMILLVFLMMILSFSLSLAEETKLEGEVSLNGVYVGVEGGEGGKAKFTEYKDLQEHWRLFGNIDLGLDSDRYFLDLKVNDPGYDTQRYELDGGIWGKYKFDLFYNEIPHNLTFDARTYYQGAGSHNLTGTPNQNFNTWNTFDYSIERKQYGAGFGFPILNPFFFDVSFQREERDGIKAAGLAASSQGGPIVEVPEPIDNTTNNLKLEGGYGKNPFFLSFGFIYSDFNNNNDKLTFAPPLAPSLIDNLALPPDNNYYRGFFKGALKLPLNSKFNVNLGYSKAKSDTTLTNSYVSGATRTTLSLSQSDFEGKINTQNYAFVLTSNPLRYLDGKIFYQFYEKDNDSDVVTQGTVNNFPFEYKKNAAGIDLGFKLPVRFLLSAGYKYITTDRKEEGATVESLPENKDNVYSGELRWNGLDFLTPKIGYEKLKRSAHFEGSTPVNRKYAYAGQDRDTYKASIDIFPVENLNFGLGYAHKDTDYSEIQGLLSDKRDTFDFSADYIFRNFAKLYGFFDYEWIRFNQENRVTAGTWEAKQKDTGWGYGIGAEFYVIPEKLTLFFQHDYMKSNGNVDYTLDPITVTTVPGANQDNIDILTWDDYTKYALKFKAAYNLMKSLMVSAGYVYERFKYNDAQLDDYQFINPPDGNPATSVSNGAWLTGYQKDQSYSAHLIFGGLTYKF
jgi:MtrB/PioB family decaheme-associated outer membrane protein